MADPPPPPPPPHGQNPRPPGGGLPDGNYDIFIIPPHSAGGGFLYLPSMQPHRNSFLLGVACTLLAVGVWTLAVPVLRQWAALLFQSGGVGVILLIVGVGVAGWAWGKTQGEHNHGSRPAPGSGGPYADGAGTGSQWNQHRDNPEHPPSGGWAPPRPPPGEFNSEPKPEPRPGHKPFGASSGWEKAKEETKKREEERKRAEELKKKAEEIRKTRDEAERAAKAKAEKEKWEQARAREKDQREREARERIMKERQEKAASAKSKYEKATARSAAGTETAYSYRPYDTPKQSTHKSTASSVSGVSEGSYAPSQSTSRTTPPPSHRGPYSTDDPDKIQIKAVYLFSDSFPTKPQSQLIANQGSVTDGLILRIKTEGLFIDDDIRGVPQREWDVKAWTLKLVEDGMTKTSTGQSLHVLRATNRDAENKKYTFVLDEREGFKVAIGLAKLRKGSQVRSLGMNGMKETEVRGLLTSLGWM